MKIGLRPTDYYTRCFKPGYDYSDIPVLFEAENIEYGDVVQYDSKTYSVCSTSEKHGFAIAEPIEIDEENEDEYNDDRIKCPVCGSENQDSWECSDSDEEYECGHCGSILSYTSEITRTFSIEVVKRCTVKVIS